MQQTFEAVIYDDHVEWPDGAPDLSQPVRARVTILTPDVNDARRGAEMVAALEAISDAGLFDGIEDPAAWQREVRQDRPLPGRDV